MGSPYDYLPRNRGFPLFALGEARDYSQLYPQLYTTPLLCPKVDCFETEQQRIFLIELPGVMKSELELLLLPQSSHLSLSVLTHSSPELRHAVRHPCAGVHLVLAERRIGTFHRLLDLPHGTEMEEIKTSYEDGVLRVEMPKISREAREKQVKVEWAEGDSGGAAA